MTWRGHDYGHDEEGPMTTKPEFPTYDDAAFEPKPEATALSDEGYDRLRAENASLRSDMAIAEASEKHRVELIEENARQAETIVRLKGILNKVWLHRNAECVRKEETIAKLRDELKRAETDYERELQSAARLRRDNAFLAEWRDRWKTAAQFFRWRVNIRKTNT